MFSHVFIDQPVPMVGTSRVPSGLGLLVLGDDTRDPSFDESTCLEEQGAQGMTRDPRGIPRGSPRQWDSHGVQSPGQQGGGGGQGLLGG